MDTMKAIVAHGVRDFRCEEVPRPHAEAGEVVIRVTAAGICAAERKIYHGTGPWKPRFPIIPGHEFIGIVDELGDGAAEKYGLEIGDKAIAEMIIPCWQCAYCRRGWYHLCTNYKTLGGSLPGGWAQYMKFPANATVFKVPDTIDEVEGVMIEPFACAVYAVERAGIGLGDTVVVSGLGPIGMSMLQVAKLKTPRHLIALDVNDSMLQIARGLGADYVFNPTKDDVDTAVKDITGGLGCDVYLEASGYPKSVETGVQLLRKRGKLLLYGVYAGKPDFDFSIISEFKELEVVGGHLSPNSYPLAIRYIAEGLVNVKVMVTHRFPLEQVTAAMELKGDPAEGKAVVKVAFVPTLS